MPTSTALASFLPNFLLTRLRWGKSCYIHRLSFDIFVDSVFIYLYIEDIMCLRRVDRFFFLLTHEPVIWKRFLERMKTPIPPLRPTFRYSFQVTDFEVEQLVTRAISLEDNWREDTPLVKVRRIMDSHHRVLDMSLLPGGKFLVASVRDLDSHRYYLTLFSLEHPQGCCAVARLPTGSKAYDLQAKYIKYKGKQGIMIAYTKRTFLHGEVNGVDPSDYSDTDVVDPAAPLWYENLCWHVSLDTLEELVDPRVIPGSAEFQELAMEREKPFCQISSYESDKRISSLSLFELDNTPHIAFVQGPTTIVFVNLDSGTIKPMLLQNYNGAAEGDHNIRTFRVIPAQHDVMVIRSVTFQEADTHSQTEHKGMAESTHSNDGQLTHENTTVSTSLTPSFIPSALTTPRLQPASGPPAPISLYCRMTDPAGLAHYLIWPKIVESPGQPTKYFFNLEFVVPQTVHVSSPYATNVLPGASRALVFSVENERQGSPRVMAVRRYLSPQLQPLWAQRPMEDPVEPISRRQRPGLSKKCFSTFNLPRSIRRKLDDEGLAAITWDEAIGRVCIACGNDLQIHIYDFAFSVRPDDRFRQWKMAQQIRPNIVDPGQAMLAS
ncbi:hypothetical protein MIND_00519000 [Mycena indigotica]|uniref:F-box domain-containing protein n=1 Tax=Mycena indigotica TaxID=2126181 RepID=A0A8H6SXT4_9AGAR|nr:uncharacterized protein MIND_00519000 [Mycena indigotica]KAF7307253.1 hypothetical protein MIND_00519000 [Mycena indigotica]